MKRKPLTPSRKQDVLERHGYRCAVCTVEAVKWEFDHIVPLALGGDNELSNFRPLCVLCHKAKTRGDIRSIRKADRIRRKGAGTWRKPKIKMKSRGFDKRFRKKLDGTIEKIP